MTGTVALRSFFIDAPEGIVPVSVAPVANAERELAVEFAGRFGLPADDASAGAIAAAFTGIGAMLGESGMEFAGVGFFRSPDEPTRPAFVMLAGTRVPSDHESPEIAVAGLQELHARQGAQSVEVVALSAGRAVVVIDEDLQAMSVADGTEPVAVLTRRATGWFPDPGGTTLGVVSVVSPSWQDWAHVCDLALDVFDSFAWEA